MEKIARQTGWLSRCSCAEGTPHCKLAVIKTMVMTMKCPVCGAAELIHDTRDLPYTYKSEISVIAVVTGDFRPACAESILDAAESNRVMREMRAFSRQVNAIVDPGFITNVPKKLDLDQREASKIFGGGVNAFSRYENGKTKPPLALVKLFKLMDRHLDLLAEK
ncbi:type II toxin-antitoxin system MqsA family antitoxin [Halothiobacillus sp.]|uniref:type II toxin-antitoxin system MqsA family antitoxin n=1 Tax=Halothiobacillus sp. TaxID=1891311 RepID=UPI002602C33C|nr:type II toxin-antitoxin system MqsA family antitoxin [Halothiobacillus sp.]